MGLYVLIEKIIEDDEKVIYCFGPNKEKLQYLKIIKKTNEIIKSKSTLRISKIYYLKAYLKIDKFIKNNSSNNFPKDLSFKS